MEKLRTQNRRNKLKRGNIKSIVVERKHLNTTNTTNKV